MFHERTPLVARGHWRGILMSLGIPSEFLVNKHGPCPICGGKDRYRWDDKDRKGGYICSQCGSGDGYDLAMKVMGLSYREVSDRIDQMRGNLKPDTAPRPAMTDEDKRQAIIAVYLETVPVSPGDLVHRYLASRGVDELIYPAALRFGAKLRDGDGGLRPCMVAMVGVHGEKKDNGAQKFCSMHRTFLKPDGSGKAEMDSPRKLMSGSLPDGACVMLSDYAGSGPLGIAEGIETAMSASALYGLPVWAALNATMMQKWLPPDGCTEVAIFGDNDKNHTGQIAAHTLARTLNAKDIHVTVHIPAEEGTDWNDVLMKGKRK